MNYFNDLITDDEYFIDVPDCIADGGDYQLMIEKAFFLSEGILKLDDFSWTNDDERFLLDIVVNGQIVKFAVEIMSDYVDGNGLISGLNSCLEAADYVEERKFCEISGEIADFGIAFIYPDQEKNLVEQGLIAGN